MEPSKHHAKQTRSRDPEATRDRILEATIQQLRTQGYHATGIDAICREAGISKGAFFHHFPNKEAAAASALDRWCQQRVKRYIQDLGNHANDPLFRLRSFIQGLISSVCSEGEYASCVLGMLSQELAGSHEQLRQSCEARLSGWTHFVTGLLAEAKAKHTPSIDFDPVQVAWMLNSLWQGTLVIVKTVKNSEIASHNLNHFLVYLDCLFPSVNHP